MILSFLLSLETREYRIRLLLCQSNHKQKREGGKGRARRRVRGRERGMGMGRGRDIFYSYCLGPSKPERWKGKKTVLQGIVCVLDFAVTSLYRIVMK